MEASSGSVALTDSSTATQRVAASSSNEDEDEKNSDTEAGRSKISLEQDSEQMKEESRVDRDAEGKIEESVKADGEEKSEGEEKEEGGSQQELPDLND